MALLIFYLLLALVVSFFCSILEAVLLSITPSYIETQLQKNKKWAHRLFHFKSNIDRPLSAILSLNTISHTVGAAGVGAQAGIVFANVSVGIISGALTLLILIFSEIIPKTLGAGYWRNLAYFTTRSLSVLTIAMYPLVWLSERLTRLFKKKNEPSIERSEITALAEVGRKEGVFTLEEAAILKNLINLRKTMVRDIMTPRTMMVVAHEKMSIRDFFKDDSFDQISRVPLYTESKDDVSGFIHKNDVMLNLSKKEEDMLLCDIKRELPVVNEDKSIYDLYNFLIKHRHHIALVKGEYGGTAGIVTMEDVLETLLGYEIIDEFDKTSDLQEHARKSWREKARRLGVFGTSTKDRSSSQAISLTFEPEYNPFIMTDAIQQGDVSLTLKDQIAYIEFFHPLSNSLPGKVLAKLADTVTEAGKDDAIKVIVLQSAGERAFCAGASFDELISINDLDTGKKFFSGFANVINAMRKCPKFIIGRVQGKAVGGGVGLASSVDYCFATQYADVKLSELAVGIGPFVVGPAVERKLSTSGMSDLAINATEWRSAAWAHERGLYNAVFDTTEAMDEAIQALTAKLRTSNPEAMRLLKEVFWKGTENWDELLAERAALSGKLVLSDFTKKAIEKFKKK